MPIVAVNVLSPLVGVGLVLTIVAIGVGLTLRIREGDDAKEGKISVSVFIEGLRRSIEIRAVLRRLQRGQARRSPTEERSL